MIKFNFSFI